MTLLKDIEDLKTVLERAPSILEKLIEEIPDDLLLEERIRGKWSIHAHATHIVVAQNMINERMERFVKEERPSFIPYFPDKESPENDLLTLNLKKMLKQFYERRKKLLSICENQPEEFWRKEAVHPEYHSYTPFIMLRHIMMHDQLHMYRIEELWLTKDHYLRLY